MTADEWLEAHGLLVPPERLPEVRAMLIAATERESAQQGAGDTELMRLCAVQLFAAGAVEDAILVWRAKTASMDADASLEVSLLCGAGLEATKSHLGKLETAEAAAALARIEEVGRTGQFDGFEVVAELAAYREYYSA